MASNFKDKLGQQEKPRLVLQASKVDQRFKIIIEAIEKQIDIVFENGIPSASQTEEISVGRRTLSLISNLYFGNDC